MQHSPNVHKKVVNNFYGEIRNFYKYRRLFLICDINATDSQTSR